MVRVEQLLELDELMAPELQRCCNGRAAIKKEEGV
jgi:hypothetical protein